MNRGQSDEAARLLEGFLAKNPEAESAYLTLGKIYLTTGHQAEALRTLERLLQRNPTHPLALELARRARGE